MSSSREDWGKSRGGRGSRPPTSQSKFEASPQTAAIDASSYRHQSSFRPRGEASSITEIDLQGLQS